MKNIFFARDPGAANMIKAIYPAIMGEKVIFAKDYARAVLQAAAIPYHDFNIEVADTQITVNDKMLISDWLEHLKALSPAGCNIITGTTHFDDYTDRLIWKESCRLKIRTFAILDQWYRAEERFVTPHGTYRPHIIFAPSQEIADALNHKKIAQHSAVSIGHPYLQDVLEKSEFHLRNREIARGKIKKMFKSDFNSIVLLASEPQKQLVLKGIQYEGVCYDQFDLYLAVKDGVEHSIFADDLLLVKLHPKEELSEWKGYQAHLIKNEFEIYDLIAASDIVVGTKSMLLLEAVMMGKPVISLDFWGISQERLVSHDFGLSKEVQNVTQLSEALNQAFQLSAVEREAALVKMGVKTNWVDIVNGVLN